MRMSRRIFTAIGNFGQNDYSFTGTSNWVDEGSGNWHIDFLTDGILTLKQAVKADLYLLGGGQSGGIRDTWTVGSATYCAGGKGGQGGFIYMPTGVILLPGTYTVTIGQGGAMGHLNQGGSTSIGTYSAPGGGGNGSGYLGGASGGSAGSNHGTNTPYAGGVGADSTVYDFGGVNRGGGGSGGYSWKQSGSTSYNWVASGGGSQGGGHAMTSQNDGAVEALANYGGGGYGYSSYGGGSKGGSGFAQIRNAR